MGSSNCDLRNLRGRSDIQVRIPIRWPAYPSGFRCFDARLVAGRPTLSIENLDLIIDATALLYRYVAGSGSHRLIGTKNLPPWVDR